MHRKACCAGLNVSTHGGAGNSTGYYCDSPNVVCCRVLLSYAMTNIPPDTLIRIIDPLEETTGAGQWRFTIGQTVLICSIVEPDNRIRIETAITAAEQLDRNALLACFAGNSGDVHFCVSDGQLLCALQYPLDALSDGVLIDAIHREVAHAGNLAAANPPVVPPSPKAITTDTPLSSSHPNWTPLLKALSDDTRLRLIAELLHSALGQLAGK